MSLFDVLTGLSHCEAKVQQLGQEHMGICGWRRGLTTCRCHCKRHHCERHQMHAMQELQTGYEILHTKGEVMGSGRKADS